MKVPMISKVSSTPVNLVVIDSAVGDRDILVNNLHSHATVLLLEADVDGIAQLGQILSDYVGSVSRLHVVSHGFPGCLRLGTAQLCLETFSQYEYVFQLWARALSHDASVLLYGCQVAAGQLGKRFVQTLSRRVGAKVAASSSPVGHESKNANWTLDFTTGQFEPVSTFRPEIAIAYEHALGVDEAFSGIAPVDLVVPGEVGAVKITVKAGGNVQSSTFNNKSFVVENVGDKRVAAIYVDISNALFPDTVFDPVGLAGDSAFRGLQFNSTGGTGAFEPGNGQALLPFYGVGGADGYEGMLLTFNPDVDNGFNSGEIAKFGVDVDPNSIVGLPKKPADIDGNDPRLNNWDIGGVSGAELINSQIHVLFADGTTAVGELIGDGSQGGSAAIASQASPNKQVTLTVNGVSAGGSGSYSQNNIQVLVSGDAGDTARIVLSQGFIQPFDYFDPTGNPVNLSETFVGSPFPANNAIKFQTVDVVLDGTQQDITSLFDFNAPGGNLAFSGDDKLPIGLAASIVDSEQLPLGPVTDPIYLIHEEAGNNIAPTSSGIANITVDEGADNTIISLFDIFDDAQDPDTALTYEVVGNTNASLFVTSPSIDPVTGELALDYAATGTGTTDITIRATDTEALFVETTFTVTVNEVSLPPPGGIIRIEAEDYKPGTNGV
ncbi:MAG: DUF4347 domain-containing protein, partial [Cyanobacteria bacterium J06639_1]